MSTIMPEHSTEITGFNYDSKVEPGAVYYSTDGDRVWHAQGGEQYAAMLIRFDVDGGLTSVDVDLDRSSDTTVLDRAIATLTELRDRRLSMGGPGYGQCMTAGDYGRCKLREGHVAEMAAGGHEPMHVFPTEAECDAAIEQRMQARRFRKSA